MAIKEKTKSYAIIIADRITAGLMTIEEFEKSDAPQEIISEVKKTLQIKLQSPINQILSIEEIQMSSDKLYTIKEVAALLSMKHSTISVYVHSSSDFREKFVRYVEGRGAYGKRLLITHDGFRFLASIDWNARKLRSPYKTSILAKNLNEALEKSPPYTMISGLKEKISSEITELEDKLQRRKCEMDALSTTLNLIYGNSEPKN